MKRTLNMSKVSLVTYMKKESSYAIQNLQKAQADATDSMQEFIQTASSHNVPLTKFENITKGYQTMMEKATVAKSAGLFEMKKVTAQLEILEQTISKSNSGFDRHYKALIAEAAAEGKRQGNAA